MTRLSTSTLSRTWPTVFCGFVSLIFAAFVNYAAAQTAPPPDPAIKFFSVKLPDNNLSYPSSNLPDLSDEHTTIIPTGDGSYLFFSASSLPDRISGAVVLETKDLVNFEFASDRGYADRVMAAPIPFGTCDPTRLGEFDLNYAAPGSVVQD